MNIELKLKSKDQIVAINSTENIILDNAYYKMKLKGTSPIMYLRQGVWEQLLESSNSLPSNYGFILFDTYRSLETQMDLFQYIYRYLKTQHEYLSHEELMAKTRPFVADPYNLEIRHKLSHPTGGAVDLGLYDKTQKKIVDMGTPFDDPTEKSATHYFKDKTTQTEKNYHQVRHLLNQTMINFEFTNYDKEWWHYDLGDYSWSHKKKISWHYSIIEQLNS
jgi:D-alanyl-D-alanine dipeptidase